MNGVNDMHIIILVLLSLAQLSHFIYKKYLRYVGTVSCLDYLNCIDLHFIAAVTTTTLGENKIVREFTNNPSVFLRPLRSFKYTLLFGFNRV